MSSVYVSLAASTEIIKAVPYIYSENASRWFTFYEALHPTLAAKRRPPSEVYQIDASLSNPARWTGFDFGSAVNK